MQKFVFLKLGCTYVWSKYLWQSVIRWKVGDILQYKVSILCFYQILSDITASYYPLTKDI